jgi:hypothetical protein
MTVEITPAQRERIARFVPAFRRFLDDPEQDAALLERQSRIELYTSLLAPSAIRGMGELEFGQVVSSLWASRLWGNKGYLVDKLIRDNGFTTLVDGLRNLLWGKGELSARFDAFRRSIRGMGTAMITELLAFVHPEMCAIWSDTTRGALEMLDVEFAALRKPQINGAEYAAYNELISAIRVELATHGFEDQDHLGVTYFLAVVWDTGREPPSAAARPPVPRAFVEDFDHNEIVDQLVNVGQWLGFQAEKEKMVARGAKVDAIWQARIANLGVVTYVFEVQRRGSIDSLILNLQRAQNNPTVQRLIVVASEENIERIRQEIATLPESFRKSIGFMEVREALRAAELIGELSGIIGKLELVRSEFGV